MGITMLVSPTETHELETTGSLFKKLDISPVVSSIPEQKGADYLIPSPYGIFGIQRKEVPHDFLLSVMDGRMARETSLMSERLKYKVVVCQGKFKYYPDTTVYTGGPKSAYRFTKKQIELIMLSIKLIKGVDVDYVKDSAEFVDYISTVVQFLTKEKHVGLFSRPGARGEWGTPSANEQALWLLQGFPDIGPTLAGNILESFGKLPLKWDCEYEDLLHVPGIGQGRAKKLWQILK